MVTGVCNLMVKGFQKITEYRWCNGGGEKDNKGRDLQMAKWLGEINLRDDFEKVDVGDAPLCRFKEALLERLERIKDSYPGADYPLLKIIEDLKDIEGDGYEQREDMNYVLERLYNWGDQWMSDDGEERRCWINI